VQDDRANHQLEARHDGRRFEIDLRMDVPTREKSPDAGQQRLLFDRAEKFKCIRMAVQQTPALTNSQRRNFKQLLEQIELCDFGRGAVIAMPRLAERMNLQRRRLTTIVADAERLALISVERHALGRSKGTAAPTFRILWENLKRLSELGKNAYGLAKIADPVGKDCIPPLAKIAEPVGIDCPPSNGTDALPCSSRTCAFPFEIPSEIPLKDPCEEAVCFSRLVSELLDLGMNAGEQAVREARRNGVSALEIEALIAYWKSRLPELRVNALYQAITHARPTQAAEKGYWPAADHRGARQKVRKANQPGADTENSSNSLSSISIPEKLRTPEFAEAWQLWIEYRVERRPKVTPKAAEAQLSRLAEWGVERAVAAIRLSIANSWQGLFEAKENQNGRSTANRVGPGQRYKGPDRG
jgi:hypothetical protein